MNLWVTNDIIKRFVFGKRVARIAAALIEASGVRLYHDQALHKEAGGGFTPAHADQYYWPLSSDSAVTAWIPLQRTPLEMGPLGFFVGSHKESLGRDLPISDQSEELIRCNMESLGHEFSVKPFDLGDVSFHLGWTFHAANENRTDKLRAVMTMIYIAEDMLLSEPKNEMQKADREQWCPGVQVGEIIASPINPVLWSRAG
jgi:ectoine hydroxylase-related dioxygenase (phytanoyl-CoA dioxygenase family)